MPQIGKIIKHFGEWTPLQKTTTISFNVCLFVCFNHYSILLFVWSIVKFLDLSAMQLTLILATLGTQDKFPSNVLLFPCSWFTTTRDILTLILKYPDGQVQIWVWHQQIALQSVRTFMSDYFQGYFENSTHYVCICVNFSNSADDH